MRKSLSFWGELNSPLFLWVQDNFKIESMKKQIHFWYEHFGA